MSRAHTHPCSVCGKPARCEGTFERNYDGFPEVICLFYHLPGGQLADYRCEDCEDLQQCDDCGEFAVLAKLEDRDETVGYRGDVMVCMPCFTERMGEKHVCDGEHCSGCLQCYLKGRDWVCGKTCEHKEQNP